MAVLNAKKVIAGLVVVAGLAALALAWRFLPLREWMGIFTDWVKNHGTTGMVVFVLGYVVGAVCLVPASLFTIAAGVAFGFERGVALAATGATIGAATSFLISRYLARRYVEQWLARSEKRKAFDAAIAQGDWKIVLLFRLTPLMPFVVSNYFFGLTKVRFWPYLIASTIGVLPGTVLYTYLGHIGRVALGEKRHARSTQEYILMGLGLIATIAVMVYVTRLAQKALRDLQTKHEQR